MSKQKKLDLIKGIGYLLVNVAIQELRNRSKAVICECCKQKMTNYMTECCHKPICFSCFSSIRQHEHKYLSISSLANTSDWGRSRISFVCPFCGKEKVKSSQTYDPDSMAAFYQAANSSEEEFDFVVRIDDPSKVGNWS